jgi:hypothetical protein
MAKDQRVLEESRNLIQEEGFKERNRKSEKVFLRNRSLTFVTVLILVLRKSVKSLQCLVNEALVGLGVNTVTASAFSQARYNLKHTAFIELNQKAVVKVFYGDDDYSTYWNKRILAVDGSKIRLPNTSEICKNFGTISYSQGEDSEVQGEHPYALGSVLYDVLNRIAIDATLAKADAYEVDLAIAHLQHTKPDDLLVMDRNYPSYLMLARCIHHQRDFVIRCSAASFAPARKMLKGEGNDSQIVTLIPCVEQKKAILSAGLPTAIQVRFVRVRLKTGEMEVLVTSLLDEEKYPAHEFLELYRLRWGIETFYGLLKTRLNLENFTGQGVESVRQDFFATIYLSGIESIITNIAQTILNRKLTKYPQNVNRAVSFNAIKTEAFILLASDQPTDAVLKRMTTLFIKNPCSVRSHRNPPRKKTSARNLLNYHKRLKKQCF